MALSKQKTKPKAKPSRQLKWQRKQQGDGGCILCGKPRNLYRNRCDACQKKLRKSAGGSVYRPGGRGRPPEKVLKKFSVHELREMKPREFKREFAA